MLTFRITVTANMLKLPLNLHELVLSHSSSTRFEFVLVFKAVSFVSVVTTNVLENGSGN